MIIGLQVTYGMESFLILALYILIYGQYISSMHTQCVSSIKAGLFPCLGHKLVITNVLKVRIADELLFPGSKGSKDEVCGGCPHHPIYKENCQGLLDFSVKAITNEKVYRMGC